VPPHFISSQRLFQTDHIVSIQMLLIMMCLAMRDSETERHSSKHNANWQPNKQDRETHLQFGLFFNQSECKAKAIPLRHKLCQHPLHAIDQHATSATTAQFTENRHAGRFFGQQNRRLSRGGSKFCNASTCKLQKKHNHRKTK
jgi:hypothetical protein